MEAKEVNITYETLYELLKREKDMTDLQKLEPSFFNNFVDYPLTSNQDGIKIKPEHMEKEHLYHCIFKNKVLLVYKDSQDFLNCYEIE